MDAIEKFLKDRKEQSLLRTLRPMQWRKDGRICLNGKEFFDFSSNDYLNLGSDERLKIVYKKWVDLHGTSSSASRLLSGDLEIFHELEDEIATFKNKEAGLVFNSGYQANVGIISSLYNKDDVVFCDKLSHASIIDGIKLSGAKLFRFAHNDIEHLEGLLKRQRDKFGNCLIVTEAVFSMDGDISPLQELVELKEKYDSWLMVDEAHATGIFGGNGAGLVEREGLAEHVELIMGTFGKALGGFGAYLACGQEVKDYLINACRSFIYSTALAGATIAANLKALEIVESETEPRKELLANAEYFRQRLQSNGFEVKGSTQIVPLITGDNQRAVDLSSRLQEKGYWVLPIREPTVPTGQARLRFSLMCCHKKEMLGKLADDIIEIAK